MKISPGKLWGLRRLSDDNGRFKMLAMDQTGPIVNPIKQKRGVDVAAFSDISAVKGMLAEYLAPHTSAVLVDPPFGYASAVHSIPPRTGLILATEWATWVVTEGGRKSSNIPQWDAGEIRKIGADAVKVNLWFRSDIDPEVRAHQLAYLQSVKDACKANDIVFLLEFLIYPFPQEAPNVVVQNRTKMVLEALSDPDVMNPDGVDVYKLEAPIHVHNVPDPDGPEAAGVQKIFDQMASNLKRPWVLLSAGAGPEDFLKKLVYAYRAGASGYLAGRAIWAQAFDQFPDMGAMEAKLKNEAVPFMHRVNELTERMARPWNEHPSWQGAVEMDPAGPDFAKLYGKAK
ncbi:tagatose 1,6-diphosphate aldolase [Devosia yakushimensis]|uniref:Tagatose 1,6-diphosphate aldolase n=1 Tax=Devosia yakushimensis TaxID=470028 RepID=A0ABQ5ULL8_9HYPH|nr:tagatose 1,6-diphosphate aldolase [Devosia yakushimensis]GLQ12054.1 tagatose 1,6-diphosphate aldolase [Devosia yakushimensis]